ncbi:MAG: ATP-binding cassette domain-containing protein, partial [Myxococcota bacterium]|nr:ATP-binding cassette domain-containing protein [Myxococcota bacterium]
GSMSVDGIELRDVDVDAIRRQIAVVHQELTLLEASVRDNVVLWQEGIDDEALRRATDLARATPFIEGLPGGYDHVIREQGRGLSVGEKQLLAIARAIARPAPIVVLDEATASIDSLTEARVDAALAELLEHRTVVLIAHRLSTIAKADRILVLHEGRVVEQGTHAALLARGGRYRLLVEAGVLADHRDAHHG